MIAALIIFLLIIIFFALFIGNNLSNVGNFWFFHTFNNVSAVVLVLISFALGIAFSVAVFIIAKIRQSNHIDAAEAEARKAKRRKEKMERMEKKAARERKSAEKKASRKSMNEMKHSLARSKSTEQTVTADNKK